MGFIWKTGWHCSRPPGPLAGFKLEQLKLPGDSEWRDCSGALIVAGNWAGWVIDARPFNGALAPLPEFVTRIAHGSLEKDYRVHAALDADSVGQPLMPQSQFEADGDCIVQQVQLPAAEVLLRYSIDQLQLNFDFGFFPQASQSGLD